MFESIENAFFFATSMIQEKTYNNYSTYSMYMKYLDVEVGLTTVCYQDSYRNQTWGSCRKGYVEPVVTIPISIIGEKTNGIWKLN